MQSNQESLLQQNLQTTDSLKQALQKQQVMEKSREQLLKTTEALKRQNKQFFHLLLTIKEKLGPENQSIFDDFVSVSQIHSKNKELEEKVKELEKKKKETEENFQSFINQSYQKSI